MIRGNEPVKANISDLTLYFVVFCLPPNVQPDVSVGCQRQSIAYLDAVWSMIHSIGYDSFTMPAVNDILKNSLKQKVEYRKLVMKIHQSLDKFAAFSPSLTSKDKPMSPEVYQELQFVDVLTTLKIRVLTGDDAESTLSTKGLKLTSSQLKLERSKTERQRPHNILAEEAAQIFDYKIPVQQKNSYCQG
ncbi:hypothetical protein LINPERPRIM_LOCUS3799 [Linum perenne]